jgi:hypothetical protein
MSGALQAVFQNQRSFGTPPGQQAFTCPGTFTWVAPAGVTSVSAVAIGAGGNTSGGQIGCYFCPCSGQTIRMSTSGGGGGGGALAYANNITVTPGCSYTVVAQNSNSSPNSRPNSSFSTFVRAGSGEAGLNASTGCGGTVVTGTGFAGGSGGSALCRCSISPAAYPAAAGGGGGGAGGYASIGGNGGCFTAAGQTKTGGGGGGGGGGTTGGRGGGGGGGAQVFGTLSPWCDTTGCGGGNTGVGGGTVYSGGGSGGSGTSGGTGGGGGNLGGGGGGGGVLSGGSTGSGGCGGFGGVRIIWPGTTRQYPSTGTNSV